MMTVNSNSDGGISKLDAAKAQLATAVRLHFDGQDPISVHTLAHAAASVLDALCRSRKIKPFFESYHASEKGLSIKQVRDAFNRAGNFFKHADRDPNELLREFSDEDNDAILLMACHDLGSLGAFDVVEAYVFYGWYVSYWLRVAMEALAPYFPSMLSDIANDAPMTRDKAKAGGREMIHLLLTDETARESLLKELAEGDFNF